MGYVIYLPVKFAETLEKSGRRLVDDYAIVTEHYGDALPPDLKRVLAIHRAEGQKMVEFVERTRLAGRIVSDEEEDE